MNKMRILFITRDFSENVERSSFYLSQELAELSHLALWHQPGNIHDILQNIPFRPDFILLNDMKKTHCPEITGLSSLTIPFGIIMHDLHHRVKRRKQFIRENRVKYIFSIYRDAFLKRYPEHAEKMIWLPHFANTHVFTDYGLPKDIDWLLMGNIRQKTYPLRYRMLQVMKNRAGFVYHRHPGYRNVKESESSLLIGDAFAREINRAKMFLTCGLIYHYPIRKYYEVLACKTLLLAPSSRELKDLGFIPGTHFVEVTEENFVEKAEYYLSHEKERENIAQNGYQLVHTHHTTQIRAKQLMQAIRKIIQRSKS